MREDKKLGNAWGFTGSFGGAVDRPAVVGVDRRALSPHRALARRARRRLEPVDHDGADDGARRRRRRRPRRVIRRYPMKFDRVNLRTSLHVGMSTLLFDVYGAPKYSTGPYVAFSPLGIDYDLGDAVRIVLDPMEIALPVPELGQLPLYYEQFRFMLGIQIGS